MGIRKGAIICFSILLVFVISWFIFSKAMKLVLWIDNKYSIDFKLLGSFGDFLGGIFGTIVAGFTLLATITIAYYLHKLNKQIAAQSTQTQIRVVKMQMKYEEFTLFRESADKTLNVWLKNRNRHNSFLEFKKSLDEAQQRLSSLFDIFNDKTEQERFILYYELKTAALRCSTIHKELNDENFKSMNYNAKMIEAYSLAKEVESKYYALIANLRNWVFE